MTAPDPRLDAKVTVEVPAQDIADGLSKVINRLLHDAWQDGYRQACKDWGVGEQR